IPSGFGGAIHSQGLLRAVGSTFVSNRASYTGGAIVSGGFSSPPGQALLTNCTFFANTTSNGTTLATLSSLPCQAVNCTLAGNTGGGISGNFTIVNSILANS